MVGRFTPSIYNTEGRAIAYLYGGRVRAVGYDFITRLELLASSPTTRMLQRKLTQKSGTDKI